MVGGKSDPRVLWPAELGRYAEKNEKLRKIVQSGIGEVVREILEVRTSQAMKEGVAQQITDLVLSLQDRGIPKFEGFKSSSLLEAVDAFLPAGSRVPVSQESAEHATNELARLLVNTWIDILCIALDGREEVSLDESLLPTHPTLKPEQRKEFEEMWTTLMEPYLIDREQERAELIGAIGEKLEKSVPLALPAGLDLSWRADGFVVTKPSTSG